MTRLGTSRVQTIRLWKQGEWFDVGVYRGRSRPVPANRAFTWPAKANLPQPLWMSFYRKNLSTRKITNQSRVQWGSPFKVYDQNEVLEWLVKVGKLPKDWRTAFQDEMRRNCKLRGM